MRCLVVAPGHSLTVEAAERCRGGYVIAVQDAYRRVPWADSVFGCDDAWWHYHKGAADFAGEKWSSHNIEMDDKRAVAARYGVQLVEGRDGVGFSLNRKWIHYGGCSGFAAVGLAIYFGYTEIELHGFDMHGSHFFGDHPAELRTTDPERFIPAFNVAAKLLPAHIEIRNCTIGSALRCFPMAHFPKVR